MRRRTETGSSRGFSLLELVGVLAVIALLAAVAVPVVIKRIDRAAWTKEVGDLSAISNALTLQIIRNKAIPCEANWAKVVADWTMRPVSQITTTPRGYSRVYLIDPGFQIGTYGALLPYQQTITGSTVTTNGSVVSPISPRLMIISSLARANPPIASGRASSAGAFSDIWDTSQGAKPANSTWAAWPGTGDDLLIQRVNLQSLFHQLILINHDTNNTARFTIDANTNGIIPLGGLGWNAYYLDGTVLGLCSNDTVQVRHVLKRNISFVFEDGLWYGQIMNGPITTNNNLALPFAKTAAEFFKSAWNQDATQHGSQSVDQGAALGAMCNFMLDYTMWANQRVNFNRYGVPASQIKTKLQIWNLLDMEGVGDQAANVGNVKYFTGPGTGLLQ